MGRLSRLDGSRAAARLFGQGFEDPRTWLLGKLENFLCLEGQNEELSVTH